MMFHFSHTSMYPSSTQLQRATFMKERMKPMFQGNWDAYESIGDLFIKMLICCSSVLLAV